MASCAGFLLFFFVVAFLHFHEYLDYHCLRDRVFFSSKTLITILPSLHYQLHYHIALGLAIPRKLSVLCPEQKTFCVSMLASIRPEKPSLTVSPQHFLPGRM